MPAPYRAQLGPALTTRWSSLPRPPSPGLDELDQLAGYCGVRPWGDWPGTPEGVPGLCAVDGLAELADYRADYQQARAGHDISVGGPRTEITAQSGDGEVDFAVAYRLDESGGHESGPVVGDKV